MTKSLSRAAGILAALILPCAWAAAPPPPIYLGIVETPMVHFVGEKHKTPYMVRIVFQNKGGKWLAAPTVDSSQVERTTWVSAMPKQIRWTVGFDGKKRGDFSSDSSGKKNFEGSSAQILQPEPGGHVPLIKQGASNFQYWENVSFRPLVCTSGSYVDDPDAWKPDASKVPQPLWTELLSAFHKADADNAKVADDHIQVQKTYKSAHGALLISLIEKKPPGRPEDSGPGDEPEPFWFYVNGPEFRLIDKSLELIDAGDYDHDGHSEVVFHKSGYDYDGYVLVCDQMRKQVGFGWSYH